MCLIPLSFVYVVFFLMFRLLFGLLFLCLCSTWVSGSFFFFFFKQKTAYEMRISDWSSDVCSSDLTRFRPPPLLLRPRGAGPQHRRGDDQIAGDLRRAHGGDRRAVADDAKAHPPLARRRWRPTRRIRVDRRPRQISHRPDRGRSRGDARLYCVPSRRLRRGRLAAAPPANHFEERVALEQPEQCAI